MITVIVFVGQNEQLHGTLSVCLGRNLLLNRVVPPWPDWPTVASQTGLAREERRGLSHSGNGHAKEAGVYCCAIGVFIRMIAHINQFTCAILHINLTVLERLCHIVWTVVPNLGASLYVWRDTGVAGRRFGR